MRTMIASFGLFARSSLYKILGILLLMAGAEGLFFHLRLRAALNGYSADPSSGIPSFEALVDQTALFWIFAAAFVLITVCLYLPGTAFGAQTGYTVCRLPLREKSFYLVQALHNGMCYLVLYAAQMGLAVALAAYYQAAIPAETVSNQAVFLALYRQGFLHSLLPLQDVLLWVRNAAMVILLGMTSAQFPYRQRRKQMPWMALSFPLFTILTFRVEMSERYRFGIFYALAVLAAAHCLGFLFMKFDEEGGNEDEPSETEPSKAE